jgi:DNA-binding NarL/FixJ family response regulator
MNKEHVGQIGDVMDNVISLAERANGPLQSPVLVIIAQLVLTRTCIINILSRELAGFEIIELATTNDLGRVVGRDVRLVLLDVGNKPIADPSIEEDLGLLGEFCPEAFVALLSNRDDEPTAMAAIQRGVRGFFPTSIPVEVAVAGLRLVLAGGIYRPIPTVTQNEASCLALSGPAEPPVINEANGFRKEAAAKCVDDFTPREQHVLAELELGLPNKLIAAKLNLSENTVKMHIQHIMRKFSAHNRTEAVLRWRTLIEA